VEPGSVDIVGGGMSSRRRDCYARLFGETGAALSDADWITQANEALPPNLSALNARIVGGSRSDKVLKVCFRPGREFFTYIGLSGGCIAEMLDQAAAHCATFVTSRGCPTLTLTVNYLRMGAGQSFLAAARLLTVSSATAVVDTELTDERERRIASASVVVHLIKEITRFNH
jgi:uncharacterized protein (TIGR00369 family)